MSENIQADPPVPKNRLLRVLVVATLALAVGFGAGYAIGRPKVVPAAKVNGEVITLDELHKDLENRFGGQVLRDMVSSRLIEQKARGSKITVKPESIEKRLKEMLKDPQVTAMVESGRTSESDLRRNLGTIMTLDALVLAEVTPAQEKSYFEAHKGELQTIRLRHIQVATEEEAADLKKQIDDGGDFSKLAREHSLDPATKDNGGDMGPLTGGQLDPAIATAVAKLAPGKTSAVVQAGLGYHLFQLVERKGDYASLRTETREAMAAPRRGDFVEALRGQAKIESDLPYASQSKASGE